MPPIGLMYLGRLSNLIVWIMVTAFAVRLTPIAPWLYFFLALTPMNIFLAASLSGDTIMNAFSFLFTAFFLSSMVRSEPLDGKWRFQLFLMAVIFSLFKPGYIFLAGLYFLIPVKSIGSVKRYSVTTFIYLCLCVSGNALWQYLIAGIELNVESVSRVLQSRYIFSILWNISAF